MYLHIFSNHTQSFTGSKAYRVINTSHVKLCQSVSDPLCAYKENRRRRLLFSCKEKGRSQELKVIRNLHGNVYQSLTEHSFFGFPLELKSWLHFWKRCTLHLNLFSLSVSERECKAIYLENQYIFTVSAWLKVMDISKTCRAWLCKCPRVLSSFVHTILAPPDISIDLLVTFFFF